MILKKAEIFTTNDTEIGDVETHKMKIQLKYDVPAQTNYNFISKLLWGKSRNARFFVRKPLFFFFFLPEPKFFKHNPRN